MFGPDILVAPILEAGSRHRRVYLPAGTTWRDVWSDIATDGGRWIESEAPLSDIPILLRGESQLPIREDALG
jgi:alpha-D-xyloside xylohydrolase